MGCKLWEILSELGQPTPFSATCLTSQVCSDSDQWHKDTGLTQLGAWGG